MKKINFILTILFSAIFFQAYSKNIYLEDYKIFTDFNLAGKELQKYLNRGGINLKVYPLPENDAQKGIYLCKGSCFEFSTNNLKKDGFLIDLKDGNIYIISKTKAGLMYGIYSFLEDNGFVFLTKDKEIIPYLKGKVKVFSKKENPAFIYREIFIKEADKPDFSLKRKLNGRFGHRKNRLLKVGDIVVLNISLNDIVPYEEYEDSNPEFFCGDQIDFTNPEVLEVAKKNLEKILSEYEKIENLHVLISTNDNNNYCENERSLDRILEGESASTPYLDFVKFLASSLKEKYPDVRFMALAYLWSIKPLQNYEKLPENMGIFYSLIEADFSIPLIIRNNTTFLEEIQNWGKLTDYIFVWHYIVNFSSYLTPFPDIYQVSDDIRILSKIPQVKGIFLQGAYDTYGSNLADLKIYIFSKLLWNPDISVDREIKKFFSYYGCNKDITYRYIESLYRYTRKNDFPLKVKTPANYFSKKFLMDMYSLLSEDKVCFKELRAGIDAAILLNKDKFDENFLKLVRKELKEFVINKKVEKYSENGDIKELLDLPLEKSKDPEEVKGLVKNVEWLDFQDFSLKFCCSDIVEDKYASDGKAIAMPGYKTDWGIQLNLGNLKEGRWKIYFVARVQVKDGTDSQNKIAFRYGVYPVQDAEEAPLEDFSDGEYHTIYVGEFSNNSKLDFWIAPPGEDYIEYLFVDRVFAIRIK